ncbi:hypothetical protein HOO65_030928 [Ceratocystis lukuohia]|uniref:Uncharacterized protein n=1 Tax=Ceratocystis lukuohia TaxID=2019550 RepID=A0ABR4MMB0_9PEZI
MDRDCFVLACKREAVELGRMLVDEGKGPDATDELAKKVVAAVERALETSTPKTPSKISLKPWWNEECRQQNAMMREARSNHRRNMDDVRLEAAYMKEQKAIRKAVVQAKRSPMSKIVAGLTQARDVFRAIKWANEKTDRRISLLQKPDGTRTTCTAEFVALLLETHTKPHTRAQWQHQEPNVEA